jgi:hypothetical protein
MKRIVSEDKNLKRKCLSDEEPLDEPEEPETAVIEAPRGRKNLPRLVQNLYL